MHSQDCTAMTMKEKRKRTTLTRTVHVDGRNALLLHIVIQEALEVASEGVEEVA